MLECDWGDTQRDDIEKPCRTKGERKAKCELHRRPDERICVLTVTDQQVHWLEDRRRACTGARPWLGKNAE